MRKTDVGRKIAVDSQPVKGACCARFYQAPITASMGKVVSCIQIPISHYLRLGSAESPIINLAVTISRALSTLASKRDRRRGSTVAPSRLLDRLFKLL